MLVLADYVELGIEVREGTPGGPTRVVGGRALCFAYTAAHRAAVRALTDGRNYDYTVIDDLHVDGLVADGKIIIDESECLENYGWLGCKVFHAEGSLIGEIGARCSKPAGCQTDHPGTGRCKFHGGNGGRKPIHGRHSKILRMKVESKIDDYMADVGQLMSLYRKLAESSAIFDLVFDRFLDEVDDPEVGVEWLVNKAAGLQKSIDLIGRMAERIVNMEAKTALTAAQVLYLQATVVDILNTYLEDPVMREKAAKELAKRFGTGSVDTSQLLIQASTMSGNVTR